MSRRLSSAWYFSYFPSGIAFGMLSVLVPLYFVNDLGGSLLDLGVMTAVATIVLIPFSIYLGKFPDRYGKSKPFILSSYLVTSVILVMISRTRSVLGFQVLYVLMNLANYITGPATSVLIAESYERGAWGRTMARRNFIEGLAQAIGLGICTIAAEALGYETLLSATPYLVFLSLLITFFAVRDPPFHIERFLSRVESPVENLEALSFRVNSRGGVSKSRFGSLRLGEAPKMNLFGIGMILFAFAASNAFTFLPIYLTKQAKFSSSLVFGVFFVRSLAGTLGYLAISPLVARGAGLAVKAATIARVVLILLLSTIPVLAMPFSVILSLILLSAISLSWSLYSLGIEVITVQYSGVGGLGVYDALASLGSSAGGLVGGAVPAIIGFEPLFIISSVIFIMALASFVASHT
ncbi:MFS transporter [Candidatus Bathyarchaeota archaeon]|nr:MFS transporter [Candidatus Bathyarchaeota archaeon]